MFNVHYKKENFEPTSLPRTRKAQFKDILSTQFLTYLLIGAILLLFALPYLTNMVVQTYYLAYLRNSLTSQGVEEEAINASIYTASYIFKAIKIVCVMIFSIGLAGVGRINREISFSKGILFKHDFFTGIKQNAKMYVLLAFIFTSLLTVVEFFSNVLITNINPSSAYILSGIIYGMLFLVLAPIFYFMLSSSTVYDLSIAKTFANSARFAFKHILICLIFLLFPIGLYLIQLIPYLYINITIWIVLILFVLPLYTEAWHLFAISKYDLYINKNNYPEIYRKGLYND